MWMLNGFYKPKIFCPQRNDNLCADIKHTKWKLILRYQGVWLAKREMKSGPWRGDMRFDLTSWAFVLHLSLTTGGVALPASASPSALLPGLVRGSEEMMYFVSINSFAETQGHQGACTSLVLERWTRREALLSQSLPGEATLKQDASPRLGP